jgi:DNA-binding NarL/FixJ family response regulator
VRAIAQRLRRVICCRIAQEAVTNAVRHLVEACRATMRGESFIYPAAVKALIRDYLERAKRGEGMRDRVELTRYAIRNGRVEA